MIQQDVPLLYNIQARARVVVTKASRGVEEGLLLWMAVTLTALASQQRMLHNSQCRAPLPACRSSAASPSRAEALGSSCTAARCRLMLASFSALFPN